VSPSRPHHHDNSCPDNNSCYGDSRTVPEGVVGGRLVRSRSDETLSNMSLLPRRRLSTVRRRKKVTADRLISDFNDGKEVDLDRLTAARTNDVADQRSHDADHASSEANVRNWLETLNNGKVPSKWTESAAKYQSLDVHHLWSSHSNVSLDCREMRQAGYVYW